MWDMQNHNRQNPQRNKAVGLASYLRIEPTHGCIEVGHLCFSPLLQRTTAATGGGWQQRILAWEEHLLSLLDRLVDRADLLARRIANGEERILPEEPLPTLALCSGRNGPFAVGLIVTAALYAVAGRFLGG